MALPTFIGIGPGRSGTSWLYEMLNAHPGVSMARGTKETEFFSGEFHRGQEWYERFFDAACPVRGEISQRYIFDPQVALRIAEMIPEARIVVTLRAPLERMISVYNYRRRVGTYRGSLAEAVREDKSLISENQYDALLKPFFARFAPSQILLCLYEDLQAAPAQYLANVLRFIGAPDGPLPANVSEIVNPTAAARSPLVASASRLAATLLRRAGLYGTLMRAKRSSLVRSVVLKPAEHDAAPELSADTCDVLLEAFKPGVEWLQVQCARDLSHWLRGCGPLQSGSKLVGTIAPIP